MEKLLARSRIFQQHIVSKTAQDSPLFPFLMYLGHIVDRAGRAGLMTIAPHVLPQNASALGYETHAADDQAAGGRLRHNVRRFGGSAC